MAVFLLHWQQVRFLGVYIKTEVILNMDDVSSPPSPPPDTTSDNTMLPAGHEPLVRYGQKVMNIPGDKFGRKHPQAGNVSHEEDRRRYEVC